LQCKDYLPFGDELLASAQNGRSGIACYSDAESRFDYFGARYCSPVFVSTRPPPTQLGRVVASGYGFA
jgi:hypothetical protein